MAVLVLQEIALFFRRVASGTRRVLVMRHDPPPIPADSIFPDVAPAARVERAQCAHYNRQHWIGRGLVTIPGPLPREDSALVGGRIRPKGR